MEVSGQLHILAALPPGRKLPVPIGLEARDPVWTLRGREKYPAPLGNRTTGVLTVAGLYR
jgi:hypothetical protein